jgi:hypothetical protein
VIALDALRRLAIVYDSAGMVRAEHRIEGGARKILSRSAKYTLVAGRFMRTDIPDTVDAVIRVNTDGVTTRHVPLPFPTDPSGRRFSDIHIGECAAGLFAAVRADTNIVWLIDSAKLQTLRTLSIAAPLAVARETHAEQSGADPTRFRFTGLLGDESGCVILSPRDIDGNDPKLDLYRIGASRSEVDKYTVALRLPLAFRRDTLFAVDESANTGKIKVLAAELRR